MMTLSETFTFMGKSSLEQCSPVDEGSRLVRSHQQWTVSCMGAEGSRSLIFLLSSILF